MNIFQHLRMPLLKNYWNSDEKLQQLHDEFIENTITNFYIPLGLPLIFSLTENTAPFHGH
jgi:hydroxymethylglutaryl-CoA reductase